MYMYTIIVMIYYVSINNTIATKLHVHVHVILGISCVCGPIHTTTMASNPTKQCWKTFAFSMHSHRNKNAKYIIIHDYESQNITQ